MISLELLQRLTEHEHVDLKSDVATTPPFYIVDRILDACKTCKMVSDAFEEGHDDGWQACYDREDDDYAR